MYTQVADIYWSMTRVYRWIVTETTANNPHHHHHHQRSSLNDRRHCRPLNPPTPAQCPLYSWTCSSTCRKEKLFCLLCTCIVILCSNSNGFYWTRSHQDDSSSNVVVVQLPASWNFFRGSTLRRLEKIGAAGSCFFLFVDGRLPLAGVLTRTGKTLLSHPTNFDGRWLLLMFCRSTLKMFF